MKLKWLACLVACLVAAAVAFADGGHLGTWKLNESKSKLVAGSTKNETVVYQAVVDKVKITVDGTGADGKPVHNEWTGKFDGKEYPVTGDPSSDARSYVKKGENALEFTATKAGKVTMTGHIELAADGKSRTVRTVATDAEGKRVRNSAVYDKQ